MIFYIAEHGAQARRCGPLPQHGDRLKDGNAGANQRRQLLVEEQKVVGLDARIRAPSAKPSQRRHAGSLGRRNVEDPEPLAFEVRARLVDTGCFNRARYHLARGRSQPTNKLSHLDENKPLQLKALDAD